MISQKTGFQNDYSLEETKLCIMIHNGGNSESHLPKNENEKWGSLFDNEEKSDVVFLVGTEPDLWRFPGHRSILRVNPVFRAMLEGPLSTVQPRITINDVDGRAFDHLLRFLYREDVQLQSVSTALATLYAATKYLCPELVDKCISYLDENINVETVLQIYQHIRLYSSDLNPGIELYHANNSTMIEMIREHEARCCLGTNSRKDKDSNKQIKSMSQKCTTLLYNCYQFIDQNADKVLNEETVEDLTKDSLYDISKRDSLLVTSELIVFSAIERWCNRECKRCQLELSKENRRNIVGDSLLFSVRYLLMTSEEFLSKPMLSGLLNEAEHTILLSHILKHPVTNVISLTLSPQMIINLQSNRSKRIKRLPIPLSMRTTQLYKRNNNSNDGFSANFFNRKDKKKKEKKANANKSEGESKCLNYTLNVLACMFD